MGNGSLANVHNLLGVTFHKQSKFVDAGLADAATAPSNDGGRLKIGPGGRVVIPADVRQALGVVEGDTLLATLVDGELRLQSPKLALRRAQAMVRAAIPAGVSLVDDLLAERRREVERDRLRGR